MDNGDCLNWLRLGATVLCMSLLLSARLTAQQAAEFTPPFEPGDILVYDVEGAYIPQDHYRLIISTGPGGRAFSDKESWFVGALGYPFISTGGQQYRHRFTVDSSGIVQHEGDPGDGRYPVYPAFIPQGDQIVMNGKMWNVPRRLDTTVLGVQTRGFELERDGLRRIITERFGETAVLDRYGNAKMVLTGAVIRDTAFNWDQTQRNYLPLCVGNRYVYFRYHEDMFLEETYTEVTEEAEMDGRTWYLLEGEGLLEGWYRSDSTGVYEQGSGPGTLIIAGNVSLGSRTAYGVVADTGTLAPWPGDPHSFFGVTDFYFEQDYSRHRSWLADFGLYEQRVWGYGGGEYRYDYIWGVICGEELGVIVDVDRTQTAAETARIDDIFPNPASLLTTVSFSLPSAVRTEFLLTDMLGRRVRHLDAAEYPAGAHRSIISLDGLRAGLYLLTLRTPSSTVTRRIIVAP
jgi:hypothetical protein